MYKTTYETTCQLEGITFTVLSYPSDDNKWVNFSAYSCLPFGGQIEYVDCKRSNVAGNLQNAIKDGKISLEFINEPNTSNTTIGNKVSKDIIDLGGDLRLTYTYILDGEQVTASIEMCPRDSYNGKHLLEYREYLAMLKELTALKVEVTALKVEVTALQAENESLRAENESLMSQI